VSLFNTINNALKPLNIPTRRLRLSSTDAEENYDQYIIVTEYNQFGSLYADDEEIATTHSIQVSLFTRLNYVSTVKEIKRLLNEIGFVRTSEYELYEDGTGYYHKVIRFYYVETE
jgi:hypothetical protein